MEFFKDAEMAFLDSKYNSENESIGEEGQEDRASRRIFHEDLGGRKLELFGKSKPTKTFMLGLQQTIPKMMGGMKHQKIQGKCNN
jgi:hypothetical protein